MQLFSASLFTLVAMVTCVMAAPASDTDVVVAKEAAVALVTPVSSDALEKTRQALDAVQKFVEIFNSEAFAGTKVGIIAEVLSKSLTFVNALLDLFSGGNSESAEMKYMREQFVEVHAKLDGVFLQLDDVKQLIEWQTTRVMYAQLELAITTSSRLFDDYMKADAASREYRKRRFVESFRLNKLAAFKLYQGVVEKDFVIAENLGTAVVYFTKNHRRKVLNFLLAMNRLILRGAHLEIAFEKLEHTDAAALILERDWQQRMERLAHRMKDLDASVAAEFDNQMKKDANSFILDYRSLSNKNFVTKLHEFLNEKFYWREWLVLAYSDVTGYHKHALSYCNGATFFRVAGERNVVVTSTDTQRSSFSQSTAISVLARAESAGHYTDNAEIWLNEIDRLAGSCSRAVFRGVICWGCDVWFSSNPSRRAYRKINSSGYFVNAILFG